MPEPSSASARAWGPVFFSGHREETVSTLRRHRRSSTVSLEVHEPSKHDVVGFLFLRIPVKVYLLFKNAEECVRLCLVIEYSTHGHTHAHTQHSVCVWVDGWLDVGGKVRAGGWLSFVDESVSQECVQQRR